MITEELIALKAENEELKQQVKCASCELRDCAVQMKCKENCEKLYVDVHSEIIKAYGERNEAEDEVEILERALEKAICHDFGFTRKEPLLRELKEIIIGVSKKELSGEKGK